MNNQTTIIKYSSYVFLLIYFGFIADAKYTQFLIVWYLFLPLVLIGLLIFAGIGTGGMLLSKRNKESSNPHHIFLIQLAITGFLMFAGFYTIHYFRYSSKFDSTVWHDPQSTRFPKDDITPRQKMVDDLGQNVLPGKRPTEVLALLGRTDDSCSSSSLSLCDFAYYIGPSKLLRTHSEYLVIWFDDDSYFQGYNVITRFGGSSDD